MQLDGTDVRSCDEVLVNKTEEEMMCPTSISFYMKEVFLFRSPPLSPASQRQQEHQCQTPTMSRG